MNRKELEKLYRDNGLAPEDIFKIKFGSREIPIVTRSGIEKIQAKNFIQVQYELCSTDLSNIIIKATARMKDKLPVESFGEASTKNTKQLYPVAMAEKRALSRVVLKIVGLYSEGHFGEDEITENTITSGQQDYAMELLETAILEDREYHFVQLAIRDGGDLTDIIQRLKDAQPEGQTGQRENRLKELQS